MLLVGIAGCTTDSAPAPAVASAPGMAILTVSRPAAMYGLAVKADVALNGAHFASLGNGETYSAGVPPGPAVIEVTCSCAGGTTMLRASLASNQQYRFLINPPAFDWNETGKEMGGAVLAGGIGVLAVQAADHVYDRPAFDLVRAP